MNITCAFTDDGCGHGEMPWLLAAFDEYTQDAHNGTPTFYVEALAEHRDANPDVRIRELTLDVPDRAIERLFEIPATLAEVEVVPLDQTLADLDAGHISMLTALQRLVISPTVVDRILRSARGLPEPDDDQPAPTGTTEDGSTPLGLPENVVRYWAALTEDGWEPSSPDDYGSLTLIAACRAWVAAHHPRSEPDPPSPSI